MGMVLYRRGLSGPIRPRYASARSNSAVLLMLCHAPGKLLLRAKPADGRQTKLPRRGAGTHLSDDADIISGFTQAPAPVSLGLANGSPNLNPSVNLDNRPQDPVWPKVKTARKWTVIAIG